MRLVQCDTACLKPRLRCKSLWLHRIDRQHFTTISHHQFTGLVLTHPKLAYSRGRSWNQKYYCIFPQTILQYTQTWLRNPRTKTGSNHRTGDFLPTMELTRAPSPSESTLQRFPWTSTDPIAWSLAAPAPPNHLRTRLAKGAHMGKNATVN